MNPEYKLYFDVTTNLNFKLERGVNYLHVNAKLNFNVVIRYDQNEKNIQLANSDNKKVIKIKTFNMKWKTKENNVIFVSQEWILEDIFIRTH